MNWHIFFHIISMAAITILITMNIFSCLIRKDQTALIKEMRKYIAILKNGTELRNEYIETLTMLLRILRKRIAIQDATNRSQRRENEIENRN